MDIHKPKPWHGLREFLKEYAIIVVGVLTALAGEQAVEWTHQRTELREAREALHEEVVEGATAIRIGVLEYRCQLGEMDRAWAWSQGGPRPPRMTNVIFPFPTDAVWESVKSGAVTRMPLKEKLAYARYYSQAANTRSNYAPMRDQSINLATYLVWDKPPPDQVKALQREIFRWRQMLDVMIHNAPMELAGARKAGGAPRPLTADERAIIQGECATAGVPFDENAP